jgi:hypothetical protein
MKWILFFTLVVLAARLVPAAGAKTSVVTTANNVSPAACETNFVEALQLLQDGDTIHFDLPGSGPFYLVTPPAAR